MGSKEISAFLADLAVNGKVSASTRNQPFFALLFLCRDVLRIDLPQPRRHRTSETTIQKAVGRAIKQAGIDKHGNCHAFRHSFATCLLEN